MNDVRLKFVPSPSNDAAGPAGRSRIGYVDGAIGGPEKAASMAALFPNVDFENVGREWPDRLAPGLAALIIGAEPSQASAIVARLEAEQNGPPVVVALSDADVTTTRRLIRAGAADILTAPVSEAALALSLERLLTKTESAEARAPAGSVVALLKAGGGTGATALGVQLAAMLARRTAGGAVCLADLDLQFGLGALYFDLADALTLSDILGGGASLAEAPLASALARHRSGARILAAPREMTPLEMLTPSDVEGLATALKRDFAISLVDLPTAWTAWTNQVLMVCERIVLITHLSVPHINLVQRQLKMMAAQDLGAIPLTLVCNQLSADQQAVLSVRSAEKAMGRAFDVVIPEDRRLMNNAVAQGCEISAVRAGSKLEKAIGELAGLIAPATTAVQPERRMKLWP